MNKKERLDALRESWANCQKCGLCEERNNVVFGEGNPDADILVLGEAPGEAEDNEGRPFIGLAGEILDEFLGAAVLNRWEDIYATNVVGCRPTVEGIDSRTGKPRVDNRAPSKVERDACKPRLLELIYIIDPLIIVTIGKVPFQVLLGKAPKIDSLRGNIQTLHLAGRHTEVRYGVMPMYSTTFLNNTYDRRSEGPWGKTMRDWVKVCNVIDYLRSAYYGTPTPNREEVVRGREQ